MFVLADDLSWNSLGANSDIAFAAPYLTALAKEGMIVSNYYAQEVCTPSRAALLTGRYPLSIGMQWGVVQTDTAWGMPIEETTLAEVLRDSGYSTHMLGKWHLGHHSAHFLPTARGFDSFTGYLNGDNEYFSKRVPTSPTFKDLLSADSNCYFTYENEDMHNYSTHFYKDKAIEIIESHDQATPLFLYLAFQAVHSPFQDKDGKTVMDIFEATSEYDSISVSTI